jgi:hypothetical protein
MNSTRLAGLSTMDQVASATLPTVAPVHQGAVQTCLSNWVMLLMFLAQLRHEPILEIVSSTSAPRRNR